MGRNRGSRVRVVVRNQRMEDEFEAMMVMEPHPKITSNTDLNGIVTDRHIFRIKGEVVESTDPWYLFDDDEVEVVGSNDYNQQQPALFAYLP